MLLRRLLVPAAALAVAVAPAGGALAKAKPKHKPKPKPKASVKPVPKLPPKPAPKPAPAPATPSPQASPSPSYDPSTVRTITGPGVDMEWGTVTVTVKLAGPTIVDVSAEFPTERARSEIINGQIAPILRRMVLQNQSSKIQLLSGATMSFNAYVQSLQAALDQAAKG